MLTKLSSNQKILLIVSGIILFIGLFITFVIFLILNLIPEKKSITEPPLNIEYCGARLEQICILSFERIESGDTAINLFVPTEFPDFYLRINRLTGEVVYECKKNEDEETNVTCVGEALNLGEQIEITLISKDGDLPIAAGKFALTAILISSQIGNVNPPPSPTNAPPAATEPPITGVPSLVTPDETISPTPSVSYPSYP